MLGKNAMYPGRNMQPRGEYGGGSYRRRGGQIMWKAENKSRGYQGPSGSSQNQMGPRRDLNAMDMDKGKGGNRTCYMCGKWNHMAKNCWDRWKKGRVVETLQESAKDNRGQ